MLVGMGADVIKQNTGNRPCHGKVWDYLYTSKTCIYLKIMSSLLFHLAWSW